ncbi:MAG: LicD family protein [Firmicutes bacterium]|nr:LicD family protein [Bacillota bacterium]
MKELDPETLRRLQMTELELLKEADRICRKNGIRYNIIAGTLLGAVRHGGFIPWDDDADIAMLRDDYERFRVACKKDLDTDRFYFQDHVTTEGYRWGYGKLRRKDTLFLREHQEHMPYEQGVFIDVFPLDPVPDRWAGRAAVNFYCFLIRKMLWSKVGRVADPSALKRRIYRILDSVPEEKILSAYDRLIGASARWDSRWVRILMFPTPNREYGYLKRWYETSEDISFEGTVFPGIRDREEYLSFKYGDYMTLPPEGRRKTHPVSDIRLVDLGNDWASH